MGISVPKNHMLKPGQVLAEIYMEDHGYNQSTLASALECSHKKVNEVVNGKRRISPAFAIQLAKVFGTTPELWSRLQSDYDLFVAKKNHERQEKTA